MGLRSGERLGAYEVIAALGAGGMGEVYRARDTKLARDVALKILPDSFAQDPERLARFKREAQVLASLNHPHIGAIYGLEESGPTQFLVLELVDGETLAQRIGLRPKGSGLPVNEALAIARQIAEALEAAHEKGIIHRDLKPANIALTANDQVKVLDFGLAKALDGGQSSDSMNSPTLSLHATQAGVILGTAAYMSPEQAKGRIADRRSDVWAFGCVLFEMLTGARAFEGEDVSDTLATILKGEPEWGRLHADVPAPIRTLLARCLAKDRRQRIADIAVAQYILNEPLSAAAPETPATARAETSRRSWLGVAAAVAALLIGAGGAWTLKPAPQAPPKPITRFAFALGADQNFTAPGRHLLALSPDATRLAYVANGQLYLRAMDQLDIVPIRGTNANPSEPFFSPDGQWIAFYSTGHLYKIALSGGAPATLCEAQNPWGASWDGDRIVFGAGPGGILEVPATGGMPKVLAAPDKNVTAFFHGPQILPGGQALLFTLGTSASIADRWETAQVVVQSLKTGERKVLVRGGTDARYVPTGHLLYARGGVLFANAFDVSRLELVGGPTVVLEGLASATIGATGAVQLAVSNAGSIVYPKTGVSMASTMVWRNRQGVDTPTGAPARPYETPRVSPDGTRVAVRVTDQEDDVWVWDAKGETLTRLTFDKAPDASPVWTKDGTRIVYVTSREGAPSVYWKLADGTGQPEPLLAKPPQSSGALVVNAVTPDNTQIVYSIGFPSDIMLLPLAGTRQPRALVAQPQFAERSADISPDGRWIAYNSDESGTFQVYVRPFPDVESGRWQVSSDGGTLPQWNPKGRELFFRDATNHLASVSIQPGATFTFGKATVLFDLADLAPSVYRNWDVAPDGSRFVFLKSGTSAGAVQLTVVENWFEELKQRVPVGR